MHFLSFLFLLVSSTLLAQPKGWRELTISDGLSQGMIFGVEQDQKGFVWVATKDGLNRYDGHNFVVFTHDPYNEYSISDDACSALLVDRRGRLWVGTLNQGLNLYDAQTQRFYHIDISDRRSANAGNYEVRLLTEDPEGNIWVNTDQDKLFKITLPNELKTSYPKVANFTSQVTFGQISLVGMFGNASAHHIQFRADGTAIVGTTAGMCTFNWRRMADMQPINRPLGIPAKSWVLSADISIGDYWFSASNTHIDGWQGATHKAIHLPDQTVSVVIKRIDVNTVAVATLEYIWLMSPAQLMAQESLNPDNAFTAMPPNLYGLRTLNKDKTGLIWIGTMGYGLRVFNPKVKQFKTYLPNTSLTYLFEDQQGRSYVNFVDHYSQLDRVNNRLNPFLNEKGPRRRQYYLMQSKAGFFWTSTVDTERGGYQLLKYSTDWRLLKAYPLPTQAVLGIYLNQTIEDKTGQLWIGATKGKLLRFNPVTETFTIFSYAHLLPQSGAETETYALYFDHSGTLWIGTPRGLVRAGYPLTKPSFSLYKNSSTDQQSLSNNAVSNMVDDPYQPLRYLWVSTKGGGLEQLDKQTGHFRHFTEAQGLPNKVVYGILVDSFKNLWMSTNRGIAQFNPRTFAFRNFTKADGLQDDEFNTGSFFKAASGKLMFGGVNGLTEFNPRDIAGKLTVPQAHIVGLRINNEPVIVGNPDEILPESIESAPAIDLSYDQNGVTLEFAVMDFTNPSKNRYRYRLMGTSDDWEEGGTNRFANYAQLPDGNYTFQMIGSSDGQNWSKPVELQIRVHPPFYRTWWAYLLYAILLAVAVWQFNRVQTQRLLLEQRIVYEQKEASRLAELDGLKTQFFTSISHEFRTPLTLILGPLADLKQRFPTEGVLGLMERNGQRLLNLINQLLDLSKLEAGQLRIKTEPGDLAVFLRTLAASFSSLASSRQIRFSFTQEQDEYWADFDRDKLEKIVTNLLSNALKFTPAGNDVTMRVRYVSTARQLLLTVQDTGVGIAPEHVTHIFERFYQVDDKGNPAYEGTGIGLALVHELIKVLNGRIDVASTQGVGTTFTVTLPLVSAQPPADSPATYDVADYSGSVIEPLLQPQTGLHQLVAEDEDTLLVIDDNADIRAYVRSIFERDYRVLEAVDGQAGLELATSVLPNIVVCDLMMPRLDGFGFCKALKAQEATSHIPVVMLTAKATVNDRIEGFELGADDYLTKPFNRTELQARVRNLIQQRRRLLQWFGKDKAETSDQPLPATLPTAEQQFMDRLAAVVNQHLDDTSFTVEALAELLNMSRVQLHRKLKAVANTNATQFIRDSRLTKAAELLTEGQQSVTQIAYSVGFDNLSYFAKVFQERYQALPSQYGKSNVPLG
ncbi:two-component regulator propeller domain-containing protein [Spirosoma flavus]